MNESKELKIGDRVQYTNMGYRSFLSIIEDRHISLDEWSKLYHANEEAMDIAITERKGTIVEAYMYKNRQIGWVVRWDDEIEVSKDDDRDIGIESHCFFDELRITENNVEEAKYNRKQKYLNRKEQERKIFRQKLVDITSTKTIKKQLEIEGYYKRLTSFSWSTCPMSAKDAFDFTCSKFGLK